jgi:hypothetical protein
MKQLSSGELILKSTFQNVSRRLYCVVHCAVPVPVSTEVSITTYEIKYWIWCSELSSGLYCRVKWLSTDVSEVRTASIFP